MAKKGRTGKSFKEQYTAYKANGTRDKNRKRKLERHLKKFPNDKQAQAALKKAKPFRKAAGTNGPAPQRSFYRNEAGHKIYLPDFMPWINPRPEA